MQQRAERQTQRTPGLVSDATHPSSHPKPQPQNHNTKQQSWLGFTIMVLLVAYHYVTADPKFADAPASATAAAAKQQ
jgi:hypothetical protein